jgi:hypothetical protein
MSLHDQAEQLREDVGDVPDPEDSIDYAGLKASVAKIARILYDRVEQARLDVRVASGNVVSANRRLSNALNAKSYLRDVVGVHDIEIPEDTE